MNVNSHFSFIFVVVVIVCLLASSDPGQWSQGTQISEKHLNIWVFDWTPWSCLVYLVTASPQNASDSSASWLRTTDYIYLTILILSLPPLRQDTDENKPALIKSCFVVSLFWFFTKLENAISSTVIIINLPPIICSPPSGYWAGYICLINSAFTFDL